MSVNQQMTRTLTQHFALSITLADAAETEDGARTFTALGIPYDEELKRRDWNTGASRQKWSEGSVSVADNNQLHYGHDWQMGGLPIGRVTAAEQTPAGLKITGQLSSTPKADEVYTLMKDGVLTKVSAGLTTNAWHVEEEGDLLVHDDSHAFEFSIVPQPAFDSAGITNVNSNTPTKEQQMTTGTPTLDLKALASADDLKTLGVTVTELERKIDTLPSTLAAAGTPARVPFTRYGEFVKAFAAGDEEALTFAKYLALSLGREQDPATREALTTLAYAGGTTDDLDGWLKDSWVGDLINVVQANRKLHNFFSTGALPATGMNVEYGTLTSNTLQVTQQANEGDTLAYGKIAFGTATAPVKTYGGYSEMTRQEVERSAMNVVEKLFTFLTIAFAKNSEAAFKTLVMNAASATPLADAGVTDLTTANGWNSFVLKAAETLEDGFGVTPSGLLVGYDVLETLVNLTEASANDKYLTRENGSINVTTMSGNVQSLTIIPISTGATTGFVRVAHPEALQTFGSPNPTQLTDGDITNLTNAYSVYGYEAQASTAPGLMIAPDATA